MQPRRYSPWPWIIIAIVGVLGTGLMGLIFLALVIGSGMNAPIGQIDFYGEIADTESSLFKPKGSQEFVQEVDAAAKDTSVKAVVIRLNSPGGSPAASQEMYRAIMRLRDKKPVVCSMSDVAASGGYYTASACDKIYANSATVTGSIGVVSMNLNLAGALNKFGIQNQTMTSGKYKDSGNQFRPMRPDEKEYLQRLIMSIYGQFVDDVVAGRRSATKGKLTKAKLLELADGRVFTGVQAKANMLVDEIGGLQEAIEAAGKLANVKGKPRVRKVRGGALSGGLDTEASTATKIAVAVGSAAGQAFAGEISRQLKAETNNRAPQLR